MSNYKDIIVYGILVSFLIYLLGTFTGAFVIYVPLSKDTVNFFSILKSIVGFIIVIVASFLATIPLMFQVNKLGLDKFQTELIAGTISFLACLTFGIIIHFTLALQLLYIVNDVIFVTYTRFIVVYLTTIIVALLSVYLFYDY